MSDDKWMAEERALWNLVAALDRCEHGRHKPDPCWGCPGGQSTGNLYLVEGTRIGTTLYGIPIVVPAPELRMEAHRWTPDGTRVV